MSAGQRASTDWQREDFERALDEYAQAVAAPLVEALRVEMEDARERARGSTHWPGCSANHRECATYERIEAALANYEAGK